MIAWLNGEFTEDARIGAGDRGFMLGDGVFETIYVESGQPAFLAEHVKRLKKGLGALSITPPDLKGLARIIRLLAEKNNAEKRTAARITVTRGAGERGLKFSANAPTLLVTVAPLAEAGTAPVTVIISARRRFASASTARFKAIGGYIENLLAHNEALASGAGEALMLNERGRLASAAAGNVFIAAKAGVSTPPVSEGALPGIVRGLLLRGAKDAGVEIAERPIAPEELAGAEIFLTNSLIGLRPAVLQGGGAMSPARRKAFRALQSWYQDRLRSEFAKGRR